MFPIDRSVKLNPLVNSYENNQLETEFKQLFLSLFSRLEAEYFDANVMATPQLGSLALAKKMLSFNGLSVLNSSVSEDELKYIFKMWMGQNWSKRGLSLIKSYLQVLYPNSVDVNQLMQDKNADYPLLTSYADNASIYDSSKFLTSRVEFNLENSSIEHIQSHLSRIFSDILPARIVPVFKLFGSFEVKAGTVETLPLDNPITIRVNNPLKISALNPFRLLKEDDNSPAYSAVKSTRTLKLDGSWKITTNNPSKLLNDLNNDIISIVDNNKQLDSSRTTRLVLDGSWKIKNDGRMPDFSMTVSE